MKTNAILLALLIFCMSLAGCVSQSDGVLEAEPADRPSVSIVLIEVEIWNMESTSGTSGWTHGFNVTFHYAAHDWYSNISEVGVDTNLDGEFDIRFQENSGVATIFIPFNETHEVSGSTRAIEFRLGAINELGVWSDGPITLFSGTNDNGHWEWSFEPPQSGEGSLNNFDAEDASAFLSGATDDTMIRMSWTYADENLNWAFLSFKLEKGDSVYTCEIATNADGADCLIQQTGDSDTQWESDEIVYIKENGADLCESSCDLSITIQYNGQVLSGTNSVTVA